jgi:hypothetical protein
MTLNTIEDFSAGGSTSTGLGNKSSNLLLLLNAQNAYYKKRYGGSYDQWKRAGTASLMAAEVSEGYAKYSTLQLQVNAINSQKREIADRGNQLLATISKQAKSVAGQQEAAFVKAGVKLEGSALNVMANTMIQANELERQKKYELDYQRGQMEIQEAMLKTKMSQVPMETLLSMGSSVAMAGAM